MMTKLATRLRAKLLTACPRKAVRVFLSICGCVHFPIVIRPEVTFVINLQLPCDYIRGFGCNSRRVETHSPGRYLHRSSLVPEKVSPHWTHMLNVEFGFRFLGFGWLVAAAFALDSASGSRALRYLSALARTLLSSQSAVRIARIVWS